MEAERHPAVRLPSVVAVEKSADRELAGQARDDRESDGLHRLVLQAELAVASDVLELCKLGAVLFAGRSCAEQAAAAQSGAPRLGPKAELLLKLKVERKWPGSARAASEPEAALPSAEQKAEQRTIQRLMVSQAE
jgi:hypothetical protein